MQIKNFYKKIIFVLFGVIAVSNSLLYANDKKYFDGVIGSNLNSTTSSAINIYNKTNTGKTFKRERVSGVTGLVVEIQQLALSLNVVAVTEDLFEISWFASGASEFQGEFNLWLHVGGGAEWQHIFATDESSGSLFAENRVGDSFCFMMTATLEGASVWPPQGEILASDLSGNKSPCTSPDGGGKSFTFNCNNDFRIGPGNLEKLVLEWGEDESCVLKLTNMEPGKIVEVSTNLRTGIMSSIQVNPISGVTDSNGEIEFVISAVDIGTDWVSWAIPNERGEFRFNKKAYDNGIAWGMFIEVK